MSTSTVAPSFSSFFRVLLPSIALLLVLSVLAHADGVRGGQLYDKWWILTGTPAPTGDHPLYPAVGQKSGSTTFRCKECHGWDYKGADGAYGSGSHFTGIAGVLGSSMSAPDMFLLIRDPDGDGTRGTAVNGHGYGALGLTDLDILDLVEMLQASLVDTDDFVDDDGVFFSGSAATGETLWGGTAGCMLCHAENGAEINFGSPESPEYVGTVAANNPWELVHKIRFSQPGTTMPSWIDEGGSDQDLADVGRFAQTLPTGQCNWTLGDVNGDSEADVADAIFLLRYLFGAGPDPMPQVEGGDVNGDDIVDLDDVVFLLNHQFLEGPPLLPSPTC